VSAKIKALYHKAGIKPPKGKGVHTKKFHSMAVELMKKGFSKTHAYATAMMTLGRNKSVKKAHRREALDKVFKGGG